jgi:hypothetical protein
VNHVEQVIYGSALVRHPLEGELDDLREQSHGARPRQHNEQEAAHDADDPHAPTNPLVMPSDVGDFVAEYYLALVDCKTHARSVLHGALRVTH